MYHRRWHVDWHAWVATFTESSVNGQVVGWDNPAHTIRCIFKPSTNPMCMHAHMWKYACMSGSMHACMSLSFFVSFIHRFVFICFSLFTQKVTFAKRVQISTSLYCTLSSPTDYLTDAWLMPTPWNEQLMLWLRVGQTDYLTDAWLIKIK